MEDVPTPSINAELMPKFVGRRVRLVCELDNLGDGQAYQARTSDKHAVTVLKDSRVTPPTTRFVEFIGTVIDANTIKEDFNSSWGDNFDIAMHNESVKLMNKYASMFYA